MSRLGGAAAVDPGEAGRLGIGKAPECLGDPRVELGFSSADAIAFAAVSA
jgi:hypothetical protein